MVFAKVFAVKEPEVVSGDPREFCVPGEVFAQKHFLEPIEIYRLRFLGRLIEELISKYVSGEKSGASVTEDVKLRVGVGLRPLKIRVNRISIEKLVCKDLVSAIKVEHRQQSHEDRKSWQVRVMFKLLIDLKNVNGSALLLLSVCDSLPGGLPVTPGEVVEASAHVVRRDLQLKLIASRSALFAAHS